MNKIKTAAVIAAAGKGTRMGGKGNKVFLKLLGKSIISRTVEVFENCDEIDEIIVVASADEITEMQNELAGYEKVKAVVKGGETRTDSTLSGLKKVSEDISFVAFHDGARPFVTKEIISAAIKNAVTYGATVVAVPEIDTVKMVTEDGFVKETLKRETLFRVQTPQIFNVEEFVNAVNSVTGENFTDDSSIFEAAGGKVCITCGNYDNIKITTPEDLAVAERILKKSEG